MNLSELQRQYEIGFRHNPKHFYANSFRIEPEENRLVVVAVVKRHIKKRFRIVGVVKERKRT